MSRMKEGVRADVPLRPRGCRESPARDRVRECSRAAGRRRPVAGAVPKKKRERSFYDLSLVVIIIVLTVFGLVMIYSASSYTAQLNDDLNNNSAYFMQRQGGIALGGFIFMLIISKMDYHWLYRLAVPSYILSHILMVIVTLVGREVNGK